MADKILTLTQESTGDNVYPNVKEENLPTEWVKTLVDKEYLTTNYYNKAYIDNNLYTKAYQDVYFLTKDSAEKTYATITSVNTISKKVDSLDTLAHQTDEDLQQYKAITYTKTDIDDNFISIATALTNEDLDTLKTEGSYYAGGSNTCTNKPSGIDAFGLTIKRVASGYYTQYLTGGNTNTGQVYTRTFTSGAWTSWVKFTRDTELANYETIADITNKLKGYEKTLNLGTLGATGTALLDILSTYFTDNNQCLLAFDSEGFIDTTTNLLSGSMVAFAQGDSDCYILSNGLIYKFNGTTATLISQDKLVSGTNIKTINGNSLLGSGDLTIEGGTAEIILSDSQYQTLTSSQEITFTEAQAQILENTSSVKLIYNNNILAIASINKFLIDDEAGVSFIYSLYMLCYNKYFYFYTESLIPLIRNFRDTIKYKEDTLITSLNVEGNIFKINDESSYYFDYINGEPIIHSNSLKVRSYTIPSTKTISIFGNHSILVPKDSTDTNIDLYKHHINYSITDSFAGFFEFYSSKNLVCDSLTDLKTLLGDTFEIQAFGISRQSNSMQVAYITESYIWYHDAEEFLSTSIAPANFTDTVTTI